MAVYLQCLRENSTMIHWSRQLKSFVKKKCKGILTISVSKEKVPLTNFVSLCKRRIHCQLRLNNNVFVNAADAFGDEKIARTSHACAYCCK